MGGPGRVGARAKDGGECSQRVKVVRVVGGGRVAARLSVRLTRRGSELRNDALGSRPSYSNDRRTWMALTTWNVRKLHITADALVTEIVAEYVKPAVQSVSSVCDTWMATSPRTFFSFPKQIQATSDGIWVLNGMSRLSTRHQTIYYPPRNQA